MDNLPFAFEEIKKYIKHASECGTVPSLSGFVRQNTDLVVRSPPEGTDFNALNGTWKKRFMTTAEILNVKESIKWKFSASMASQSGFALYCGLLGIALARVMMWEAPVRFRPGSIKNDAPDWNSIIEMRHEERITVKRRKNTYLMYENENEIIGNQLSKNQENRLASHKSNLNAIQKKPSPKIVNYDGLVSKSIALDDGYQNLLHQITNNTYINEISVDENILRVTAKSLAKPNETKYFGDFLPHFIKYKESQINNPFSCTNDDIMDIRGESGFSKFLSVNDYIKLRSKKPRWKVEVPEVWRKIVEDISDWINITKNLNILSENDGEEAIKIKEIESFAKSVPDVSASNTSEHHYWTEFGHRFFSRALQELVGLDWRVEVPVHASKYRKNYGCKHIIDKVVDGKSADLLAWIEKTGEEIFVGEQAGPPTKCDLTKLATDSFKLYREMRDCLNFRILQAMRK
ncbi:10123_t:CDS:10, partial [Gigaspora margarita]